MLDAALKYATVLGWLVFPCRPYEKVPLTSHGFKEATADPDHISKWWTHAPLANLAIATGARSKMFVVDVDQPDGERSLERLQHEHGELPLSLEARTVRGGKHILFRHPGRHLGNRVGVRPGVDVRGDGGYIVAAPSELPSGRYEWLNDPFTTLLAPAPDWILSLSRPRVENNRFSETNKARIVRDPRSYAISVLARETVAVARAAKGRRNDTLNRAAFAVGRVIDSGDIEADFALPILREAGISTGLLRSEVEATLQSGLRAGLSSPALLNMPDLSVLSRLLWALPLSPRAKLLLAVLHSHSDQAGQSWPSQRTLLKECSVASFTTLQKLFREVASVLEVGQCDFGQGRPCSSYRLLWEVIRELARKTEGTWSFNPLEASKPVSPITQPYGKPSATTGVAKPIR